MITFLPACRTEFGNNTYAPCTENGVSNPTISSGIPNTNNASSPYDIAGLIGAGIVVVLEVFCHHWL